MTQIIRDTFQQRSDEKLDYDFDFSAFLLTDTISGTPTPTIDPVGELTLASSQVAGGVVKAWLQGGIAGRDYIIKCQILTAAGRKKDLDFILQIRD